MRFVGLDLTSAFPKAPRPIDVAILGDDIREPIRFGIASWPRARQVSERDGDALVAMIREEVARLVPRADGEQVWALDGPQALARVGSSARRCEVLLATPGRTPCSLPDPDSTAPFQSYIRSSVDLFAGLRLQAREVRLIEVFPGAEWRVLAAGPLPKKASKNGREIRRSVLESLGISGLPALPTADQNDAAIAAYLAWCSTHAPEWLMAIGDDPFCDRGEQREGRITHLGHVPQACTVRLDRTYSGNCETDGHRCDEELDWAGESGLAIRFTDSGLVHGNVPENRWLETGRNYQLETCGTEGNPVHFEVLHSATFSGGRGWKCRPSVRTVLGDLAIASSCLADAHAITVQVTLLRGRQ